MKTNSDGGSVFRGFLKPLLCGSCIGAIVSIGSLFLLALIATWIDVPPIAILPLAVIPLAFGSFFGGFACAKLTAKNGWLMGILSALLLFVVSWISGIGIRQEPQGSFLAIRCLIMIGCGMVGGMLALNLRKEKRK